MADLEELPTMADYVAPVRDINLALDVAGIDQILAYPHFAHVDRAVITDLVSEFGRFVATELGPLNRVGDREHSRLDAATGVVTTPTGFKDAYAKYVAAGWGAVPFPTEYGGGAFPWTIAIAFQEMLTSANMGFSLCPLLTQGAIDALLHHGSEEQRETYLRHMVSGEWTGTMNLTEPGAGSDVGALISRALPEADGSWRIFGQKIFITYGEHDMAANQVHLVLARLPDAPPGTKGVSLFLVPKFLVNADGTLGARNDARCVSIEHKMGINASPTCVMSYGDTGGGAIGWMIGEPNTGMRAMFTMMNNARLSVGLEGLAMAERAYQDAYAYAIERVQGRPIGGALGDAIVGHPDVRRMLLTMRSQIQAMRGLVYLNAASLDHSRHGATDEARRHGSELADLLTPLSKAWCTDLGVELTSIAVQIFGGMGYVEETGVAQHYRDSRIAPIYEGTNGIQALDLVGRKLAMCGGDVVRGLLEEVAVWAAENHATTLLSAESTIRLATEWILAQEDPTNPMAGATPYLRALATVIGGWQLGRQGAASGGPEQAMFTFYCEQILPSVDGLCRQATAGAANMMAPSVADLASR